ncbi:hypothetical protein GCM10010276_87290 [Streptomyces longisporus]|uniref:Uncharacterized protein n=1 Tax=Streptomyces longisporus TaxID=1948 RepID=A0ABP6AT64_STRLO
MDTILVTSGAGFIGSQFVRRLPAAPDVISLQLGGDSNDYRDLWVEPADPGHKGSGVNNKKDPVETKLHTALCNGQITLSAAQQAIVTDWTTALTTSTSAEPSRR